MKRKELIWILSILVVVIIAIIIGVNIYGNKKEQQMISKKNNEQINEANEIKEAKEAIVPNTVSKNIMEIDKTNYDTKHWWKASKEELINQLEKEEKQYNDEEIGSIIKNVNEIPLELIRLAVMHPETITFVAGYPNRKLNQPINIDNYYVKGEIPLFEQFDPQWGYDLYGKDPIAINGCGPTSLAMVAVGLTGNKNINPKVVADYSEAHGGYEEGGGSTWTLMTTLAPHFGIVATKISPKQVIEELKEGHPVIADEGVGEFTLTGHYLVLTGVTKDGKIKMNNPDSIDFSNRLWTINEIDKSAMAFWSYKKIS
ncbi:MAG: C39 family peptidase [Sarcina sp.]